MLAQAIRKKLGKAGKEEKGFTLIELLAVIVILGIIAVIAVPMIGKIIDNSKADSDLATARQIYDAARLYVTAEKGGNFANETVDLAELTNNGYIETGIRLPSSKAAITSIAVTFNGSGVLQNVTIAPAPKGSATGGVYSAEQIQTSEVSPSPTPSPVSGG